MAESLGLLSFVGGNDGYCAVVSGPGGASALRYSADGFLEASSPEPAAQGRVSLDSDAGPIEVSWSPAGPMLEFGIGSEGVRAYAVAAGASDGLGGPGLAWELPAEGFAALRTIWAATDEGGLTLLVAVRPEGGATHEEELIGAARLIPGAEPYAYVEPLLSTEYDRAGSHVRATLELWAGEEERLPERDGGRRVGGGAIESPAGRLEGARFAWKLDGSPAVGGYEILTP